MERTVLSSLILPNQYQDSSLTRFFSRNVLIIIGFSFIGVLIALITVALTQNRPLPENRKYGIVLDAGSSHTSLYVYAWSGEKENDTGVVSQIAECTAQGPGISKFGHKTDQLATYLTECMDKAKKLIPFSKHHETPVYLGATAGMRLLRNENPELADKVMNEVSKSLSSYPFNFRGARIITGSEEGAFGWITINYLMGRFTQKISWFPVISEDEDNLDIYGALDLGGASTQITFVPSGYINESTPDILHFLLYGKNYDVYSHSFLCYGKDQALLKKLAKDLMNTNGIMKEPCFHPGYNKVMNLSEIFKTNCTDEFRKNHSFLQVEIQGSGDFNSCQQSISELFNTSYCPYSHCAFNGVFMPQIKGNFGAFSGYYYVMDFFNLTSMSSVKDAINKLEFFCSRPWKEVKETFANVKEKYLSEYCFSGTYILSLLRNGYHFPDTSWSSINIMGKVYDSNVGWTLGYMLNLTNLIPAEQVSTAPLSHSTYVFLMVFFSLILVALIILSVIVFHKPSYFNKDLA
ncbi:ectonucleoside triphosphate diphosphohydrolase 1 isoform X1 [Sorex fumeus]|uniref:ectonucleoside triphosphate diphosphohydrolase 1 isoform X1 n=2 Tax=Sorex fumeus TaxID=62283 RepID=UPI0024AE1193|nr:ectonucleoside triphosphate diphosphohydrolase 1 isoform X1 [Sorex fumeus]